MIPITEEQRFLYIYGARAGRDRSTGDDRALHISPRFPLDSSSEAALGKSPYAFARSKASASRRLTKVLYCLTLNNAELYAK